MYRSALARGPVRRRGIRGLGEAPSFNYDTYLGMQQALNYLGYTDANGNALAEDGTWGDRSKQALISFQKDSGIVADGSYGPQSKGALQQAVESKTTPDTQPSVGPSVTPDTTPSVTPDTTPQGPTPSDGGGTPTPNPAKADSGSSTNTLLIVGLVAVGVAAFVLLRKK